MPVMQRTTSIKKPLVTAVFGILLALVPALALFDFTVDDALIIARYATNIARGSGYRWNSIGPITDTVTPLGFPYLLAPFAQRSPLDALAASKIIGLVSWLVGASLIAIAVERSSNSNKRFAALLLIPACAPLAAWSVGGLETGLVTSLCAIAVSLIALGAPYVGASCVGLAAALRPELLPFAFIVALAPCPDKPTPNLKQRLVSIALAVAPFVFVVAVRLAVFGRPTPLAVLAKPSDPTLGLKYAVACFLLTGPIAIVAPIAVRRMERFALVLTLAIVVHFGSVAVAGGDWMPLSRLVVPILPACVLVAAYVASVADARATAVRLVLALAGQLFVMVKIGPTAARVGPDRLQLVREFAPAFEGAKKIGALDVGWVGAATDASIVDFAGLTDPVIAALPGGHTTKRIPAALIDSRGIDTLVLLRAPGQTTATPWTDTVFARGVEQRIAQFPGIADEFVVTAESGMPSLPYVVLRRRNDRPNERLIEGP